VALLVFGATDGVAGLERRFYDLASTHHHDQPSDRVAVIAIDDASIDKLGPWPWPRDLHAQLIDQLSQAQAQTVVYTVPFSEPQADRGLAQIRKMQDVLDNAPELGAAREPLATLIADAQTALDTDAALAHSIERAGNVLLPAVFALGDPQASRTSHCRLRCWPRHWTIRRGFRSAPSVANTHWSRWAAWPRA